jgi:hypothetical protein
MKNIIAKTAFIAAAIVLFAQAPSKAISFNRSTNTLISFELVNAKEATITIRNSQGRIVKIMNVYSGSRNLDASQLQAGTYTYTISNGKASSEGSFSVK